MISRRIVLGCVLAASSLSGAAAQTSDRAALDALIARHAKAHGVPESLVHRVVRRESNYNPRAYHRGNWGLMQIRHGTARSMGYTGSAAGLLDANTNLSYAVPYLANAYRVAGGDQSRAVSLYASGFYYVAKRRGLLGSLKKGPIGGDPAEVAQAQPAPPTLGSWLTAAFTPPAQAQAQQVAMAETAPEAAEEPAAPVSRRRGRRARLAALAKAAAAPPAAEPQKRSRPRRNRSRSGRPYPKSPPTPRRLSRDKANGRGRPPRPHRPNRPRSGRLRPKNRKPAKRLFPSAPPSEPNRRSRKRPKPRRARRSNWPATASRSPRSWRRGGS